MRMCGAQRSMHGERESGECRRGVPVRSSTRSLRIVEDDVVVEVSSVLAKAR